MSETSKITMYEQCLWMLTNLFKSKEENRLGDDFYIENVNQGS